MLRRRLNDGREFQIYKVFYDVSDLEDRLQRDGWQIHVSRTEKYFLYGYGGHNGA
jgi:demethylmenaquinone methyltransferase/2-methoxy-6-polyprenyl-1,4-benzoquinol methylase